MNTSKNIGKPPLLSQHDGHKNPMADVLIAACIALVLFLHQDTYGLPLFNFVVPQNSIVTMMCIFVIGGFVFVSGYKLTNSKLAVPPFSFFLDRFIKIFPLYLIALLSYYYVIQPGLGVKHLLLHVFGLQVILYDVFGPPFLTLYFIGLVGIYYSIFIVTRKYAHHTSKFLLLHGCIIALAFALHLMEPLGIKLFEYRFFLFYIFFVAGIMTRIHQEDMKKSRVFASGACVLPLLAIVVFAPHQEVPGLVGLFTEFSWSYFLAIPSLLLVFIYVLLRTPNRTLIPLFSFLSYSSFAVFLFHRQIWYVFEIAWRAMEQSGLFRRVDAVVVPGIHWVFVSIFGTAVLFALAYQAQYFFDKGRKRIESFTELNRAKKTITGAA